MSVKKDKKVAGKEIDKQISQVQQKAVKASYIPKLEFDGKYLFAYSRIESNIGDISGFESISQLQHFMQTPTFPAMFPNLAGLSNELTHLQQLMTSQGMSLPGLSNNIGGDLYGNYIGVDATAKMLLYSGGQVPNTARAINQKIKAQDAQMDKCATDVINEVITSYDQLALMNQSRAVLDMSALRLAEEKKFASVALKNGIATEFDTLKIAVADANLNAKIAEYESKKASLSHKLAQLTGKQASDFDAIRPELEPLVYTETNSGSNNRAELRALSANVEAQKYMLKAEQSHSLPKIQAFATGRYDNIFKANANFTAPVNMDMKINHIGLSPTLMAGVGFKWELFDKSGGSAKVNQARLGIKKAENEKEEAFELLELNLIKVTGDYKSACIQLIYKDKQRQAASKALDMARKSYKEGYINITERLAMETEVQNAELEYLQSVFAQRQTALECYKAKGDLNLLNIR